MHIGSTPSVLHLLCTQETTQNQYTHNEMLRWLPPPTPQGEVAWSMTMAHGHRGYTEHAERFWMERIMRNAFASPRRSRQTTPHSSAFFGLPCSEIGTHSSTMHGSHSLLALPPARSNSTSTAIHCVHTRTLRMLSMSAPERSKPCEK